MRIQIAVRKLMFKSEVVFVVDSNKKINYIWLVEACIQVF